MPHLIINACEVSWKECANCPGKQLNSDNVYEFYDKEYLPQHRHWYLLYPELCKSWGNLYIYNNFNLPIKCILFFMLTQYPLTSPATVFPSTPVLLCTSNPTHGAFADFIPAFALNWSSNSWPHDIYCGYTWFPLGNRNKCFQSPLQCQKLITFRRHVAIS